VDNTDNNLFTDITGDEASAGGTEYRKIFRKNNHGSLSWQNVVSWLQSQPTNSALSFGFGVDHAMMMPTVLKETCRHFPPMRSWL
jgi:hypothetical protein